MAVVNLLLALFAAVGHASACIFLNNRLHAYFLPRPVIKSVAALLHGLTLAGPILILGWWLVRGQDDATSVRSLVAWLEAVPADRPTRLSTAGFVYGFGCLSLAVVATSAWAWRRLTERPPNVLIAESATHTDLKQRSDVTASRGVWKFVLRAPFNESLSFEVNEKRLCLPRLTSAWNGLSILHISDLHFTGRIRLPFFEQAMRQASEVQVDLVAVTGDLIDKPQCLDWLPQTLGRLAAPLGMFFVLGNHDRETDHKRIRQTLVDSGWQDLGGRTAEVYRNGRRILLAGNELPWFRPAADIHECDPDTRDGETTLRVLLSHSPDQLAWARRRRFDLMLAGHTHGGQIRPPIIGPIVAPSKFGVRYAGGVFFEPPTVMHVSRGLSGKTPLRFRCVPEITRIMLTGPQSGISG